LDRVSRELGYDYEIFFVTRRFPTLRVKIMYDFSLSINKTLTPLAKKENYFDLNTLKFI